MRRSTPIAALALAAISPFAVALDRGSAPPVPAGAYTIDKPHTSLIFRVSHMTFSSFTGRFTNITAKLDFDPAHLATSAAVGAPCGQRDIGFVPVLFVLGALGVVLAYGAMVRRFLLTR